jgi:hypothetical protein
MALTAKSQCDFLDSGEPGNLGRGSGACESPASELFSKKYRGSCVEESTDFEVVGLLLSCEWGVASLWESSARLIGESYENRIASLRRHRPVVGGHVC